MQRIIDLFPTRATLATAAYPDGSSKNETSDGANDGTPYDLGRANDIFGMQQSVIHQLGIVPSGLAETAVSSQFLDGVARLASLAQFYADTGAADVYVLSRLGAIQADVAYFDGMEIQFKSTNTNTGATTANVSTLGAKAVTLPDGTALSGGEIVSGRYVRARYNLGDDRFELETPATAPGAAGAWVNFNGTGVVAIRASLNVSSVTDNGAGDYTLNFTTPFVDANYCYTFGLRNSTSDDANLVLRGHFTTLPTVSALRIVANPATGGGAVDNDTYNVAIHR